MSGAVGALTIGVQILTCGASTALLKLETVSLISWTLRSTLFKSSI